MLRSESPSGKRAKLRTVAASNDRDHAPRSLYYCLFAPRIYSVFFANTTFVVNRAFQRNASGVVATSLPSYNEPHRSHVLCVKAEPGTTFTSWSQHHFVARGKRAKLRTVATSNNRDHTPRSLCYCLFAPRIYSDFLRAHHVRGEPRITAQRQRSVATIVSNSLRRDRTKS